MSNINGLNQYKREMAEVFTKVASTYDTIGTPFFSYFGEKMVDLANIQEGSNVLDIACGKGASLIPASKKVSDSGSVIGIDLSEGMINDLSSIIERRKLKNVKVNQADAENLDFPDGFFDVVLCGLSLPLFPRYKLVLDEIKRVLNDNGIIALSTWNDEYELKWRNQLYSKYVQLSKENNPKTGHQKPQLGILRKLKHILAGGLKTRKQSKPQFGTRQGIRELLADSGFQNINVYEEELDCCYKNEEEWNERMWSQGSRRVLEKITPGNIEKFKKEAFENLQHYKKGDSIVITMSAIIALASKG